MLANKRFTRLNVSLFRHKTNTLFGSEKDALPQNTCFWCHKHGYKMFQQLMKWAGLLVVEVVSNTDVKHTKTNTWAEMFICRRWWDVKVRLVHQVDLHMSNPRLRHCLIWMLFLRDAGLLSTSQSDVVASVRWRIFWLTNTTTASKSKLRLLNGSLFWRAETRNEGLLTTTKISNCSSSMRFIHKISKFSSETYSGVQTY